MRSWNETTSELRFIFTIFFTYISTYYRLLGAHFYSSNEQLHELTRKSNS